MESFIEIYNGAIETDFCDHLIRKFEKSNNKLQGRTGQGVDLESKDSSDITLSDKREWKKDIDKLEKITWKYIVEYMAKYSHILSSSISLIVPGPNDEPLKLTKDLIDTLDRDTVSIMVDKFFRLEPINLQRYLRGTGGYHHFHSEIYPQQGDTECKVLHRVLAFLYYLNDVDEGGETEFYYQNLKVKPKKGTLAIFPCGFTHTHKGHVPISNDKYVLTSWILYKNQELIY